MSQPFPRGAPEPWATAWGEDRFGAFQAFEVAGIEVRLRWIPPGQFLMGSPEDEEGRWDDEGPQHLVTITRGLWLAETPCTQALYEAVTGTNPSHFKGPTRPVEQVSWPDAQAFLATLGERLPGLHPRLPTEAEWEYACRAGTTGARYPEPLDEIAWYSENSRGQTHPVGEKRPNPWGLHDLLGNVLEWCHDDMRPYTAAPQVDPLGSTETGAARVIRGGSWFVQARLVRAADRDASHPGYQSRRLGFRLARGQGPDVGAEPARPG